MNERLFFNTAYLIVSGLMGANCRNCLEEGTNLQGKTEHSAYSEHIQQIIGSLRQRYSDATTNARDYRLSQGALYRGSLEEGKKQGYGEFYNEDNAYFGAFADDLPHGEGLLIKSFSQYIKGNFLNGKLHGQGTQKAGEVQFRGTFEKGERLSGILKTSELTYQGTFKGNKFNGFGTIQFKNGDRYQGYFKNGNYHGDGKYETQAGTYIGQFLCGKYDGRGIYRWKDGSYYEGEYRSGIRNGYGKIVKGQFIYEGYWTDGQPKNKQKLIAVEDTPTMVKQKGKQEQKNQDAKND